MEYTYKPRRASQQPKPERFATAKLIGQGLIGVAIIWVFGVVFLCM